jgi:hypothetical protein
MMTPKISKQTYWVIGVLLMLSVAVITKGCKQNRNTSSPTDFISSHRPGVRLKISKGLNVQATVTEIIIEAVAVDDIGNPTTGITANAVSIPNPTFPLHVPFGVAVPPCDYQIMVTVFQEPGLPQIGNAIVDACNGTDVDMFIETFDTMIIPADSNPIHAPEAAIADEEIMVSCGPVETSTSMAATLSEEGGESVSGAIDAGNAVSGIFSDPFPLDSPEGRRVFTCRISGQSGSQTFTKSVRRLSLSTPTIPTITAIPSITPELSPTPEITEIPELSPIPEITKTPEIPSPPPWPKQ